MIRVPLLPTVVIDRLAGWIEQLDPSGRLGDVDEEHLRYAVEAVDESVGKLLLDPFVREAIAIASPSLDRELETHLDRHGLIDLNDSLRRSLLGYVTRMAIRPTPFGLHAGTSMPAVGSMTTLAVGPRGARRKYTRIDAGTVYSLARELETDSRETQLQQASLWFCNTAATEVGGRFVSQGTRYGEREHGEASVRATAPVRFALNAACHGITLMDLEYMLLNKYPALSRDRASAFLSKLVEGGFLYSDIRPPLVGAEPMTWLQNRLRTIPGGSRARDRFTELHRLAATFQCAPVGAALAECRDLHEAAPEEVGHARDTVFYVDTTAAVTGKLGKDVVDKALEAALLLARTGTRGPDTESLLGYRNRFIERYGARIVPLMELIDPFVGLGFPDHYSPTFKLASTPTTPREAHLLRLAVQAGLESRTELVLSEEDLATIEDPMWSHSLPDAFDVYLSVLARSIDDLNFGRFDVLPGALGTTVGYVPSFSRLGGVLGSAATKQFVDHAEKARKYARGDDMHVELSCMPIRASAANVSLRPFFGDRELLLGIPPTPHADGSAIPWSEIGAKAGGRGLEIWWIPRNVRLRIHGSHLLNQHLTPPLVRLVSDIMASQSWPIGPFEWRIPGAMRRMPRLRVGSVILRLAEWRLTPREILSDGVSDLLGFARWIVSWRRELGVPRSVTYAQADRDLFLDLENPCFLEMLYREVLRSDTAAGVVLREANHLLGDHWLAGQDGSYSAELVVPFARKAGEEVEHRTSGPPVDLGRRSLSRSLIPGSEWIYAKLYCSSRAQVKILREHVPDLVAELGLAQLNKWFFVRFSDPDEHLRLRFQFRTTSDAELGAKRVLAWANGLHAERLVYRVALDTYEREVERYGGPDGIDLCEDLFRIDSEFAVSLVALGDLSEESEILAVFSVDRYMRGIGLTVAERTALYKSLEEYELSYRGIDWIRESRRRFRADRPSIEALMDEDGPGVRPFMRQAAERLRREAAQPGARLRKLARRPKSGVRFEDIVLSLIHMHCNRMLGIDRDKEAQVSLLLSSMYRSFESYVPEGIRIEP